MVTSILFVASLSSFDQVMEEDGSVNRMKDSITIFEEISNNEMLAKASIILFLNKRDLFEEKFDPYKIGALFPDYNVGTLPSTSDTLLITI